MKKESMVGRRLYAWIIDTLLLFVMVFLFDGLVSQPISKKITNIDSIQTSYIEHSNIYEDIQDEYGIYIYDENGNRLYNDEISEENKNNFLLDQRIIDLNKVLIEEQEYILTNFICRILISISIPALVVYVIIPIILKENKSLGKFAAKLITINEDESRVKWYKTILRGIITIIVDIYIGLLSLGMIPLISLLIAILTKENKTLVDYICKTRVIDGKLPFIYKE